MTDTSLLTSWVTWPPLERAAVRGVYFHRRSLADTAHQNRVQVDEVSRALHRAYHRVAALVLDPDGDSGPGRQVAVSKALCAAAASPIARWSWDTVNERMTWSDSLYELYGYPARTVAATIGLHQAHKHPEDRAAAEKLVLAGATEHGPVVFSQRIVRTDGTLCRVVMQVTRRQGPGEVLTGHVVVKAQAT